MFAHRRSRPIGTGSYLAALGLASLDVGLRRMARRGDAKMSAEPRVYKILRCLFITLPTTFILYFCAMFLSFWMGCHASQVLGLVCFLAFFGAWLVQSVKYLLNALFR